MKKIAIFVEGQTEQIFLKRLIVEFFGKNVTTILKRSLGGKNVPRQEIVSDRIIAEQPQFMIMISDCGSDNRVKTELIENIESLKNSGYDCIIGMRDLYPLPIEEYPKLEKGLRFLPKKFVNYKNVFDFIIVIQEVETWFLAEAKHFQKVDKRLTDHFIKRKLGFDPYHENAIQRKHPAKDIDDIYRLVGKSYSKRYWQVDKLVKRLDFNNIIYSVRYQIPSLNELITILEDQKKKKY